MADIDEGLQSWQLASNHNRMIDLQKSDAKGLARDGTAEVELSYYGGSAFKVTSPTGLTVMIDPWRNLPTGKWDWYFHDFPRTAVDIGVSTHAHFDHDALHRLDAHVLLDRLIGVYEFGELRIIGIAEKHATDSSSAIYDFKKIIKKFGNVDIEPPHNPRSWDNCLIIVETGDLRILHWGDNRHNPPNDIWDAIGPIDIALLPIDGSQHVLGFQSITDIIARLKPKVVVPHHYYIWDVVQRSSTLLPVSDWIDRQPNTRTIGKASNLYSRDTMPTDTPTIDYFGDHVAFDREAWHRSHGVDG